MDRSLLGGVGFDLSAQPKGSEDPTKRGTKYSLRRIAEENALGGGKSPGTDSGFSRDQCVQ
ncbi:MAG: hypothetical protein NW220_10735 [Leptolyngbyaceae cyanobacterium bins.349]|nr:hypothetical protein [Leptolyngbyaceae cyanobacterium bins.349]